MKEEGVDQRIAYDPTIGFTLKKIGISDSGTYMCQVDSKTNLIATMILQVKERK
jgi:Trk K+ transport system NAD-binding subunit